MPLTDQSGTLGEGDSLCSRRDHEGAIVGKKQLFAKVDFSNGEAEHKAQVMPYLSRGAIRCLSHSMGLGAVPQGTHKTRQWEKS